MLSFTLLGQATLSQDGVPLSQFRSQKEAALLIYLAHAGQTHSREHLAELLWESNSTKQALSNLRTALTRLRKQVRDELVVTRKTLSLDPESLQQVDSVHLLAALASIGPLDSAEKANDLLTVLDAYHGDFLADFSLPGAPQFEEWITITREQIRRQVISAFRKLGQYALLANDEDGTDKIGADVEAGISIAQRWLLVDTLDEEAHALLIKLLIKGGQIRAALTHYGDCVNLLRDGLGITPSTELTALIQTIQPSPSKGQPSSVPALRNGHYLDGDENNHPLSTIYQLSAIPRHNLPPVYDEFFGRVAAQEAIHNRLDLPWCRLVTIVGPGGVGKTRLATTVARSRLYPERSNQNQMHQNQAGEHQSGERKNGQYQGVQCQGTQYQDGVWLVELADVDPTDDDLSEAMAVEIATALDLRLSGAEKPVEQVITFLEHKAMLLVLDNFEHLLGGAGQTGSQRSRQSAESRCLALLLDLLQRCQHVQFIVTSREALQVRAEWSLVLQGLEHPTPDHLGITTDGQPVDAAHLTPGYWIDVRTDAGLDARTDIEADNPSEAVALFMERYAQQQAGTISPEARAAAEQICGMVEGLPLAIELAAALTRDTTVQGVVHRLRDGFDELKTPLRDVPQRHRSLRTVFEMSWQTLTPAVQQRLARLSIFRGGFTKAAAQEIAQADADDLTLLVDKSLLAHDTTEGRYQLHAVVRAFADEKLASTSSADAAGLASGTFSESVELVAAAHACYYLRLLAQHAEPLQKSEPQLSVALLEPEMANVRLAWQTGLETGVPAPPFFSPPQAGRADGAKEGPEGLLFAALPSLSVYYQLRGLAHEAETVMRITLHAAMDWGADGLALATRAGLELARFQNRLGRYPQAIETIELTLELAAKCDDSWAEGMGHVMWGESLWRTGEYDRATDNFNHALTIAESLESLGADGSTMLIGWGHHHLGVVNDIQGRYADAHEYLKWACDAWQSLNNNHALSNSLNSMGITLYNQGNLPLAQQTMEEALTLCDQLDNRHLRSVLLNNLGMISTEQGDYLSAHHYLQIGLKLAIKNGNLASQGEIYNNLGKNYRLLGKTNQALGSMEQGLNISELIGNRRIEAISILGLAHAHKENGDSEQAESLYNQALRIAQQDDLQYVECEALLGMAELFYKKSERDARKYSTKAVVLAESIQNADLLEQANAINDYLSVTIDS